MELEAFLLVKEPFNETSDYINHPLDTKIVFNAVKQSSGMKIQNKIILV